MLQGQVVLDVLIFFYFVAAPEQQQQNQAGPRNRRRVENIGEERWEFEINWPDIYAAKPGLKERLIAGRKLTKPMRLALVARAVNQVRMNVPNANRRIFLQVMADMKLKHSRTFKHELANGVVGKKTIAYYMQAKFDNDHRANQKTRAEAEAPAFKAAYGCVQWRLAGLPPQQTPATQEELRAELVDIFQTQRESAWNWNEIRSKMNLTYGTLRSEINSQAESIIKTRQALIKRRRQQSLSKRRGREQENDLEEENVEDDQLNVKTTAEIQARWPFLFQPSGMASHFLKLTNIDLEEKFTECVANDLDTTLEFLIEKQRQNKKVGKKIKRAIEEREELTRSLKYAGLLKMLTNYFQEDIEFLVRVIEVRRVYFFL